MIFPGNVNQFSSSDESVMNQLYCAEFPPTKVTSRVYARERHEKYFRIIPHLLPSIVMGYKGSGNRC